MPYVFNHKLGNSSLLSAALTRLSVRIAPLVQANLIAALGRELERHFNDRLLPELHQRVEAIVAGVLPGRMEAVLRAPNAGALTSTDVRTLYELLLGRQPESDQIIETQMYLHDSVISLTRALCDSDEFRLRIKNDLDRSFGAYRPDKSDFDRLFDGYRQEEIAILQRHLVQSAPEAGFVTDFVGTRMRIGVASFTSAMSGVVFDRIPLPGDFRVEAVEWIGALKAIEGSGSHFVAIELGAGWGPWIVSSGHVARRLGKTVHLYAVEADPGKVPNIAQHLIDNGFAPKDHVIFGGIAGPTDGFAYFPVIDAVGHWGGEAVYGEPPARDYHRLPSISLRTLMKDEEAVDFLHIDIQGAEFDVVKGSLDALCAKVKWIVIGTHSRSIEGRLLDLLLHANWSLENERPCRCSYSAGRPQIIVDGTQVWKNPNVRNSNVLRSNETVDGRAISKAMK
jgi:FkbM family methyltransferase